MNRQRIRIRWGARAIAYVLHVGRPMECERLCAPNFYRHGGVGSLRNSIHHASRIDQAHLYRVKRRTLRLLGQRAVQAQSSRAHVPELAAHKITLLAIVVEHGRETRVGMRLRVSSAEARPNGAGVSSGRLVESAHWSAEPRLRHVTKATGLVPVDRKIPVVEDEFAEQREALKGIQLGRLRHLERFCLDAVDL